MDLGDRRKDRRKPLQNALDKLDVHSRSELAARALELGLLP